MSPLNHVVRVDRAGASRRPADLDPTKRTNKTLLEQFDERAKDLDRPSGCLPAADGLALEELLTSMRQLADNEVAFVGTTDELATLRSLSTEEMWEVNRQMYKNLDVVNASLKAKWGPENMPMLEKSGGLMHRRQGWHYFLAQVEGGAILISLDWQHVFEVQGARASLLDVVRRTHPDAELPLPVYVSLIPWTCVDGTEALAHDGIVACSPLADEERLAIAPHLRRRYEEALDTPPPPPEPELAKGEEWNTPELNCVGIPPPPEATSLATTRAVVRAYPLRLTAHPTIKHKLAPHALVNFEDVEEWPGRVTGLAARVAAMNKAQADAVSRGGPLWLPKAIELYGVALASFPPTAQHRATLHSNRALCQLRAGDAAAALADGTAATEAAPEWAKGWARKASALHALGRIDAARAAATHALSLCPDDAALQSTLQTLLAELERGAPAPMPAHWEQHSHRPRAGLRRDGRPKDAPVAPLPQPKRPKKDAARSAADGGADGEGGGAGIMAQAARAKAEGAAWGASFSKSSKKGAPKQPASRAGALASGGAQAARTSLMVARLLVRTLLPGPQAVVLLALLLYSKPEWRASLAGWLPW